MSGEDPYYVPAEKSRFRKKAEEYPLVAGGIASSLVMLAGGSYYIKKLRELHPERKKFTGLYVVHLRLACCGIIVGSMFITSLLQPHEPSRT